MRSAAAECFVQQLRIDARRIEALVAFLRTNPGVSIDIEERSSEAVIRGIQAGAAEIGVCRDIVPMADLETFTYGSDRFAVIVPQSHPLASRDALDFVDTLSYPQLGVEANASVHALIRRAATHHQQNLRFLIRVSNFDAAFRFIAAGLAIAVLPLEAVSRYAKFYGLKCISLRDPWAERAFCLCVRHREELTPAAKRLLDHFLKSANKSHAPHEAGP